MIAVTFSVPHESRSFRRVITDAVINGNGSRTVGTLDGRKVLVAHIGIGQTSAESGTRALLAEVQPRLLIAAGYAGALDPRLRHAEVVAVLNYSAAGLLARYSGTVVTLTTQCHAAQTAEAKTKLARSTGAQAVDMETSAIVRVAMEYQIPTLALRAISDAADKTIPVPLEITFDLTTQRPRPFAIAAHLARHPSKIVPFARFVGGLGEASTALATALVEFIRNTPPDQPRK